MSPLSPDQIVQKMMDHDAFSQWLGIEVQHIGPGTCTIGMTVGEEMVNGFFVAHGGITFSLADSAFAFASNSRGLHAVSIETSISHTRPVFPGDILEAKATELQNGKTIARYEVTVTCGKNVVALFKGTVFKKDTLWT
jgi:acyl-CoA thioesterase